MSTPHTPEPNSHLPQQDPVAPESPSAAAGATQPTVQLPASMQQAQQDQTQQAQQPAPPAPHQAAYPMQPPAYAQQAAYPGAAAAQRVPQGTTLGATNTFALVSIILAFTVPIAGIVFGHLGLNQIKRTGDAGRGIALTGLIVGYASFALLAIFMVLYIGFIVMMFGFASDSISNYSY